MNSSWKLVGLVVDGNPDGQNTSFYSYGMEPRALVAYYVYSHIMGLGQRNRLIVYVASYIDKAYIEACEFETFS